MAGRWRERNIITTWVTGKFSDHSVVNRGPAFGPAALSIALLLLCGCASPTPLLTMQPSLPDSERDVSTVNYSSMLDEVDGKQIVVVMVEAPDGTLIISPMQSDGLKTLDERWFNLVFVNLSDQPIPLSTEALEVFVNNKPQAVFQAEELEARLLKRKRNRTIFATSLAVLNYYAYRDVSQAASAFEDGILLNPFLSEDDAVVFARVERFRETVLLPHVIAPGEDHGGLFMIGENQIALKPGDLIGVVVNLQPQSFRVDFEVDGMERVE